MATAHQVQGAIQMQVQTALAGILPLATIGIGWPSIKSLQALTQSKTATQAGGCIIGVYDLGGGKDSTRWASEIVGQTITNPGVTLSANRVYVAPGLPVTLVVENAPIAGDAIAIQAVSGASALLNSDYAMVNLLGNSTLQATAIAIAHGIALDPILSQWVSAVASGVTVQISTLTGAPVVLGFTIGNGGTHTVEIGRKRRSLQVVCWTTTEADRQRYTDPLDTAFEKLEYDFGITLLDGTLGRLWYENDRYIEDATFQDLYRRDFVLMLDYAVTFTDTVFALLAPTIATEINGATFIQNP